MIDALQTLPTLVADERIAETFGELEGGILTDGKRKDPTADLYAIEKESEFVFVPLVVD
jgi:hypothetical protein